MRFNFALTTFIAFVVLFFINLDSTYSQELVGEDERIIITVDSMERFDSFPEKYKNPPMAGHTTTYNPPKSGNDFVFIHITVVEKKDLRIDPYTELGLSHQQLIDEKGETHRAISKSYSISIIDDAVEWGYMMFEIPMDVSLNQLNFNYGYREEPPKPQEMKTGQINIDILHVQ